MQRGGKAKLARVREKPSSLTACRRGREEAATHGNTREDSGGGTVLGCSRSIAVRVMEVQTPKLRNGLLIEERISTSWSCGSRGSGRVCRATATLGRPAEYLAGVLSDLY